MTQGMNAVAPHHLPPFITPPGETDVFLVGCAIFLVVAVISLGSLYFRLHALPEHLSHGKASKLQFEVVSVMALLALFTHNNWFWVAALLLAIVPVPDFYGPLAAMAESLAKMARWPRRRDDAVALEASTLGETLIFEAGAHDPRLHAASRVERVADLTAPASPVVAELRPQPKRIASKQRPGPRGEEG